MGLLGKSKKRLQAVLVATEDRRLVPSAIPVHKGYIADHKTREAWALYPETGLTHVTRKGEGPLRQLLSERSNGPYDAQSGKWRTAERSLSSIAEESLDETLSEDSSGAGDRWAGLIKTVVLLFSTMGAFLIVVGLLLGGHLHV